MKTIQKISAVLILFIVFAGIAACSPQEHADPNIDHWTCSMHPQVNKPGPGQCPICGMDLVPVYKQGSSLMPGIEISPDRQQQIGIKKASAQVKHVYKDIRTFGRIAYDPSLAVAQKDYLEAWRGRSALLSATRTKLKLLGMSDSEIAALPAKKGDASGLFLPGPKDTLWVYATLFEEDLLYVKAGDEVDVTLPAMPGKNLHGVVRSVDPVVDALTRTLRARIELTDSDGTLRPDQTADAVIHADLGENLTIPATALFDTGQHQWVYVDHADEVAAQDSFFRHVAILLRWHLAGYGKNRFERRAIVRGGTAGKNVVIAKGLTAGETVVDDALFFVDSESQLK